MPERDAALPHGFRAHPWHGIHTGDQAPRLVNCFIEIVPDDTVKFELDKVSGFLRVDRPQQFSNQCPTLYGLIPRTNRGIFAINELPDLAERIQVGLFNIMEERDIQIRGYRIRLSLDVFLVSSANPRALRLAQRGRARSVVGALHLVRRLLMES